MLSSQDPRLYILESDILLCAQPEELEKRLDEVHFTGGTNLQKGFAAGMHMLQKKSKVCGSDCAVFKNRNVR